MGNNQYKGFAYTKGSDKPTVVYGASSDDILAKLNSYNIARTEQDKFMKCNIGSLNTETSKYEDYHRYEVATGKDISPIYLQIPPLGDNQFRKVIADLDAADAKFNSYKKRWYITPDQDLQKFQAICNQFSNENTKDTTQQTPKKTIDLYTELEKIDQMMPPLHYSNVPFQIERMEIQYAVKLENQQTVIIPESALHNKIGMNGFLDELNEKAIEQLQQISSDLEQIDPEQIASESEYMISVDRNSHFNRCTVWFNDGREPVSLNGYVYGLDFLSMETNAVAEFVSEYLRQQDHPENGPSPSGYREGDWINCYVPLRLQDSSPNQPIYVENIRYISGTVQAVQPSMERDGSSNGVQEYTILDDIGSVQTIRSDEIYTDDQARVLLRAAADELTGVQFDLLADKRLTAAQMEEIRFGFKDGLSAEHVALYANPEMTPAEMDMCRIGLTNGLGYSELSRLLKETKELSWTDSRNRLNEVIKDHRLEAYKEHVREEVAQEAAAAGMTVDEYAANGYEPYAAAPVQPVTAPELSEIQAHIIEHIDENFVKGSVSVELVGNDRIRITDLKGESMNLAMTQSGGIIDADTNKIYGYAKDGYRPPAASEQEAQTADFYGMEVPLENGMRVITIDAIYHVNEQGIEKPDFSNCVFRGIDFPSFFPTSDVNFANSKFYQCRIIDFDMSQSNFRGASLQETYMKDVVLEQCDFSKAHFENVRIKSSELTRVNFSETTMKNIYFENCGMDENDFNMTNMDCVHVYESCDITEDQKNLDTVTYTISGADPAEIEKMKDKVMWRLSGSEITYERKEELSRLFEKESNDPDTQEWREDLTYEESELVVSWDKQRHMLADVLLEKQHRQERYKERYNNMAAQSEERRSVVNQLHEKQKMVSVSAEAPVREDRIKKADAIAK